MQAIADKEGAKIKIEPWDYRYYAEKVRKAQYDLDQNEVKPYLQLEKLREGMFWVAGELFGFDVHAGRRTCPVYHPDVRVWEVTDKTSRQARRPLVLRSVRARRQALGRVDERLPQPGAVRRARSRPSSRNNSNFVKGKPGEPVLISWDDADDAVPRVRPRAARALRSNVTYPSLVGHRASRATTSSSPRSCSSTGSRRPRCCSASPLHYQTGKPIPQALVDQDQDGRDLQPGLRHGRVPLVSALVDMKLHLAGRRRRSTPTPSRRRRWPSSGMPTEIVMRHRTPQFGHVFSGDGYSAGYYSYLWSDVLTADAFEAFTEGRRPVRQEGGRAPAQEHLLGRQHRRPGRRLPRLPRPRPEHRGADAQARLPRRRDEGRRQARRQDRVEA